MPVFSRRPYTLQSKNSVSFHHMTGLIPRPQSLLLDALSPAPSQQRERLNNCSEESNGSGLEKVDIISVSHFV